MGELLSEHQPHFGTAYFVSYSKVSPGDVITFTYTSTAVGSTHAVGKMRWIFVLDPDYKGKCHALDLSLTPRDTLIHSVIDAMYSSNVPLDLYESAVYQVAKELDSYRTYFVDQISNPRRITYHLKEKPVLRK